MREIWEVALAVLTSLGGGAIIIAAFSSWIGKVWADRILEKDRLKYQAEMENIKSEIAKKIHEHNVAVSRIDTHRAEIIQKLYAQLVCCFNLSIEIRAPAESEHPQVMIPTYTNYCRKLRVATEEFEVLAMHSAIYISEESYAKVAQCGLLLSNFSIDFKEIMACDTPHVDPYEVMAEIQSKTAGISGIFSEKFNLAKSAVLEDFRKILDPRLELK